MAIRVVSYEYLTLAAEAGLEFRRMTEQFITARMGVDDEQEGDGMRYEVEPLDDGMYGVRDTLAQRPHAQDDGITFKTPHRTFAERTAKRLNEAYEAARALAVGASNRTGADNDA